MEGVLLFFLMMGSVGAVCWIVSGVDAQIQRKKGIKPNAYGRIEDGILSKVVLGLIVGGFVVAYIFGGGSGETASGCFGSMRC